MRVLTELKSIYEQVISLFDKKHEINPNNDIKKAIHPIRGNVIGTTSDIIATIYQQNIKIRDLENKISDIYDGLVYGIQFGLDLSLDDPQTIQVTPGEGLTNNNQLYKVNANITLLIDMPLSGTHFILLIEDNTISIGLNEHDDAVTLGKIIVQNIESDIITENRENDFDAFLYTVHEIDFDNIFQIDDSTIPKLRNFMEEVLASSLVGEINLTEHLKIANARGTVDMDSENIIFYDNNHDEIAKYGGYEARIGNIVLEPDRIRSKNYSSRLSGFEINKNGNITAIQGFIGNIVLDRNGIHSSNYESGSDGFNISKDGDVEFNEATFRGHIEAPSGEIGGWYILETLLESAESGSRIELNSDKNRISIFDAISEKVVMGYLDNLDKNDGTGTWNSNDYGFWVKPGDNLVIDGDIEYESGDWLVQNDASVKIFDGFDNEIVRLGTDSGEKGIFIWDDTSTLLAKFYSGGIYIGNDDTNLTYNDGTLEITGDDVSLTINEGTIYGSSVLDTDGLSIFDSDDFLKTRVGNLTDLTHPDFNIIGYGLYADNVYLNGEFSGQIVRSGSISTDKISAPSGTLIIDADNIQFGGEFYGVDWTEVTQLGDTWSTREGKTTVIFDDKIWILGGYNQYIPDYYFNDVYYTTDGETWVEATSSANWVGRKFHSTVVFDDKIWVSGGYDGTNILNDVWYSSDGINWTLATASADWNPRYAHTMLVFDNKMWVIGGTATHPTREVWYSSDGINWTSASLFPTDVSLLDSTAIVFDGKIWVFAYQAYYGTPSIISSNSVYHSTDGISWTTATERAAFSSRFGCQPIVFDNEIWILGGYVSGEYFNDVWHSPDGSSWTRATNEASWTGRQYMGVVAFNDTFWILGGTSASQYNDVWYTTPANLNGDFTLNGAMEIQAFTETQINTKTESGKYKIFYNKTTEQLEFWKGTERRIMA